IPLRPLRVLVVDDEPLVGAAVARLLGDRHDITVIVEAEAAIARLTDGPPVDVVLCDLMMPGTSGIELFSVIEHDPELARRFVFVTGGSGTPIAASFLARVTNPVVEKPFDAAALTAAIAAVAG
ncbi:MAG: response regulator, partial [Myxococcota bacterium]